MRDLERNAWQDRGAVGEYVESVRSQAPVNEWIEKPALHMLVGEVHGLALLELECGPGGLHPYLHGRRGGVPNRGG